MPAMSRARVLLPPPLGPVMTTSLLSGTARLTPRMISLSPLSSATWKDTFFNSSISFLMFSFLLGSMPVSAYSPAPTVPQSSE